MKYLKTYEKIQRAPKISDYVIAKEEEAEDEFKIFIANNIGQVVDFFNDGHGKGAVVRYNNIPQDMLQQSDSKYSHGFGPKNTWLVEFSSIVHSSPNKEDLEHYISAGKYNL